MESLNLTEILLTPQVLALAAGIIALLSFIGKIPLGKKRLASHKIWRHLLPVLPIVIGIAAAFAPGVSDIPRDQWGSLIIFGVWSGFVAAHGRKIGKRWFFDKLKDTK